LRSSGLAGTALAVHTQATEADVDTYKTIITKRDTRSFTDQPVSDDAVRRIVQAGRMAGSSKNVQPCRFIIIDDPSQKEAIAKCGDFAGWIPSSPLIIAIATTDTGTRNEFDAGRAAQNMMIAAWGEEIGSCPVCMDHVLCARDTLGLPEGWRVPIVLAFGYRAKAPKSVPEAARLPWDDYVRRNRW
jgi:nitroreductase